MVLVPYDTPRSFEPSAALDQSKQRKLPDDPNFSDAIVSTSKLATQLCDLETVFKIYSTRGKVTLQPSKPKKFLLICQRR
jgi:hypothetical protein